MDRELSKVYWCQSPTGCTARVIENQADLPLLQKIQTTDCNGSRKITGSLIKDNESLKNKLVTRPSAPFANKIAQLS